jgi:hypothetical protein
MVKPSEVENNLIQSATSSSTPASDGARKLYARNLHANISEEQLRQVSVQIYYSLDLVHCVNHLSIVYSQRILIKDDVHFSKKVQNFTFSLILGIL